ncbi:hypothetical protein [Macrococcus animalis]|uniref:hypothetical protein n=1 Tax=Macrococcus animalis TaxID=3395467 RepID=UPI0039BE6847
MKKTIAAIFSIILLFNGCSKTIEKESEKDLKKTEKQTKSSIKLKEREKKNNKN